MVTSLYTADVKLNKTDKEYPELLEEIINLGIREHKNKNSKTHSFDTRADPTVKNAHSYAMSLKKDKS